MTPIFTGQIRQDGTIEMDSKGELRDYLKTLAGKAIELIVRQRKSKRSANQRAYYWAVIVKMLADETGYSKDEMNEILKVKFNGMAIGSRDGTLRDMATAGITIGKSIENEKTDRVEEIYQDIREWAFEFFNLQIPLPNEVNLPEDEK